MPGRTTLSFPVRGKQIPCYPSRNSLFRLRRLVQEIVEMHVNTGEKSKSSFVSVAKFPVIFPVNGNLARENGSPQTPSTSRCPAPCCFSLWSHLATCPRWACSGPRMPPRSSAQPQRHSYAGDAPTKLYEGCQAKSLLYGIWDVERYTSDGVMVPALISDLNRPRRILFQAADQASF